MKKKDYQQPSMRVVQLRQRLRVLEGSPDSNVNAFKGTRTKYEKVETTGNDVWSKENNSIW